MYLHTCVCICTQIYIYLNAFLALAGSSMFKYFLESEWFLVTGHL